MTCQQVLKASSQTTNLQIAILSKDRADQICTKTLVFLQAQHLDLSCVTIFAHPGQAAEYRRALRQHEIVGPKVRTGMAGLSEQMRKIYRCYNDDTHLVIIIDIVSDVLFQRAGKIISAPSGIFQKLTNHAWELMKQQGVSMWG